MTSSIYLQVRLKALVSVSCAYDKYYLHKLCLVGSNRKDWQGEWDYVCK